MKRFAQLAALLCLLAIAPLFLLPAATPQAQPPPQAGGNLSKLQESQGGGLSKLQPSPQPQPQVIQGQLTKDDSADLVFQKSPYKVHSVKFQAGQHYQIDLESKDFDAFLCLVDALGKPLAYDGNGHLDPRLLFTPGKDGSYRIIVTALPQGQMTGAYTLTIRPLSAAALAQAQAQQQAEKHVRAGKRGRCARGSLGKGEEM